MQCCTCSVWCCTVPCNVSPVPCNVTRNVAPVVCNITPLCAIFHLLLAALHLACFLKKVYYLGSVWSKLTVIGASLWSLFNSYCCFRVLDKSAGSATGDDEEEEDPDVKEAVNELVPDLATEDEEAHLNLSLEEESSIIAEYRTLILSAGYNASCTAGKPWKQHINWSLNSLS